MIFDEVLVPWDRVFVYNDAEIANAIFPDTSLRSYTAHQTSVRGLVKLEFAVGVAMAVARAVRTDRFLHVQQMLGECVEAIEIVRACITRRKCITNRRSRGRSAPRSRRCSWRAPIWRAPIPG